MRRQPIGRLLTHVGLSSCRPSLQRNQSVVIHVLTQACSQRTLSSTSTWTPSRMCHPPVFCESNAGFFTILYFSHGFVVLELTSFIRGASWFTQRGKYKNCSKGDSPRRLDSEVRIGTAGEEGRPPSHESRRPYGLTRCITLPTTSLKYSPIDTNSNAAFGRDGRHKPHTLPLHARRPDQRDTG